MTPYLVVSQTWARVCAYNDSSPISQKYGVMSVTVGVTLAAPGQSVDQPVPQKQKRQENDNPAPSTTLGQKAYFFGPNFS
jgi:hypothetical protein